MAALLLLWTLCIATATASPIPINTTLISDACRHTTVHYDLCLETISANPNSKTATDVPALISIVLEAASAYAVNTSTYVDHLTDVTNDTTDGPSSQACLEDCTEEYLDVTEQLDNALIALEKKAYGDLKRWVETVVADVKTCQESCKAGEGEKNVLTKRNGDLERLSSIVLSLTNLVSGV